MGLVTVWLRYAALFICALPTLTCTFCRLTLPFRLSLDLLLVLAPLDAYACDASNLEALEAADEDDWLISVLACCALVLTREIEDVTEG